MMNNRLYDALKFIAQIVLPALGTLYASLAEIWGFPFGSQITSTILALDTFMGAVLMISKSQYTRAMRKLEMKNAESIGAIEDNPKI